jgi:hypothetical protein
LQQLPEVAAVLSSIGTLHAEKNRNTLALAAFEEAARIYKRFADIYPAGFGTQLKKVQGQIERLKTSKN